MVSHSEVLRVFYYDPGTGIMTRRATVGNCGEVGAPVGTPNSDGHLVVRLHYKIYYVHRLAWFYMTGEWPRKLDHKNRIKSDNRWKNLREATNAENARNRNPASNNTTGHSGVGWFKQYGKWRSMIKVNGKSIFLGYFDSFSDAVAVRKLAEIRYFGDFAPIPAGT